jgi:glutathione S-transferase
VLEECGFQLGKDWETIAVDIGSGEQFNTKFLAISPNNKIPAVLDPHLKRWFDLLAYRPAVERAEEILADLRKQVTTDKEREGLFGVTQYQKH